MLADLKFAVRTLAKTPGFTAIAIFTLAQAIGVNSPLFSLVHSVILRQVIPVKPEEVVSVFTAKLGASKDYRQFSHAEYMALRNDKSAFADVAAQNPILAGIGQDDAMRRDFAFQFQAIFSRCSAPRPCRAVFSAPRNPSPTPTCRWWS